MRHSIRLWLVPITFGFFATSASAVVIGDKDWMGFSEPLVWYSGGASGAEFDAIFDSTTGQCDVAVCVNRGIDYTGYVWASTADVNSLLQTYGFQLSSLTTDNVTAFSGTGSPIGNLINDFGNTDSSFQDCGVGYPCLGTFIQAITRDQTSADTRDLIYLEEWQSTVKPTDYVGLSVSFSNSRVTGGGWFYKQVPEPGAVALLGLGLAGLGLSRRRKAA